jgi:hypothetical protein
MIFKGDIVDLLLKYQELLRVTQNLVNFLEDNNVRDDFDAYNDFRSQEFTNVLSEVQMRLLPYPSKDNDGVTCLNCTGFDNEVCTVRGIELHDYETCNAFELEESL